MKENAAKLFPNPDTAAKVMDYSIAHSTPLPDWLMQYHEWGCSHTDVPDYLTSTYQAQTLVFLARMMGAKRGEFGPTRLFGDCAMAFGNSNVYTLTSFHLVVHADMLSILVLEIGVYIGFSAMFWSHAVGKDGSVVGLELSEKYATQFARKAFAEHNINNVTLHVGDAVASLKALTVPDGEPFDIVFIDANKEAYPEYLDILLSKSQPGQNEGRLLRPGGLIVADNVLRSAIVADDSDRNPNVQEILKRQGTMSMEKLVGPLREFNKKLLEEPRLETVLLPMFDGLGLARLKD